jgi:hypothetical protein
MIPEILIRSGSYFSFLEPHNSTYTIEDIAHALSRVCRFGGHTESHYSVAQHSVLSSYLAEDEFKFDALMHDAAEAFLGDIPSPLKMLLPDYKTIEIRVEKAIFERFGVSFPLPQNVKEVDKMMLAIEKRDVIGNDDYWEHLAGVVPLDSMTIVPLPAEIAFDFFMSRYEELKRVA